MHVERLDIRGYRRLRGGYEFASGLTLVTGPNEAGKSTLHDAVLRSLFGFSPEERRHRRNGSSAKDERMPWAGGPFGMTLRAHGPKGRAVLVKWDFADDLVELQDALTGESLLRERPKQRADFEIGRQLVGMTREEFVQVCCLHQQALDTVRPSDELHQALQRAVESAPAQDIGVQGADDRLKKLLSGLGVQSGHYGELPGGELGRLKAREEALRRELEAARAQRAELDGVAVSLAETQTTRAGLGGSAGLQQAPAYPRELVGREGELRNQLARLDAREGALQAEGDRSTDGALVPPTDNAVAPPAGRWNGRLLNIHPALLPQFKGLHTHRRALDAGVERHGATVHFVVPEMDSGPIVMQESVPVIDGDTEETLAARVLALEHRIYPQALRLLAEGRATLSASGDNKGAAPK